MDTSLLCQANNKAERMTQLGNMSIDGFKHTIHVYCAGTTVAQMRWIKAIRRVILQNFVAKVTARLEVLDEARRSKERLAVYEQLTSTVKTRPSTASGVSSIRSRPLVACDIATPISTPSRPSTGRRVIDSKRSEVKRTELRHRLEGISRQVELIAELSILEEEKKAADLSAPRRRLLSHSFAPTHKANEGNSPTQAPRRPTWHHHEDFPLPWSPGLLLEPLTSLKATSTHLASV